MADDLVTASDAGPRQFRVLLEAAGNGEHADRNRKVAKDIEQTPSAATAAVLEYGFDKRHAATRLRANSNVVEHTLGNIIAVRERALAAALDVEIEIDRDQSAARPRWIRGKLAISDEIAGDHRIRLWFKHLSCAPAYLAVLRKHAPDPSGWRLMYHTCWESVIRGAPPAAAGFLVSVRFGRVSGARQGS